MRGKSENLGSRIDEAKEKYDAAWERISFLSGIVGELSGKRIEQRAKQENVQKLKRNLKEMTDSDQQLEDMLFQYVERVGELQSRSEDEKKRYQEIMRESEQTRESLSAQERECGSLEAQKASYERSVAHREQLVKQTARKHNIRGYDFDIDEDKVQDFVEKINRLARDQNTAFERARRETQQELQQAQKTLNHISEQKSALNQKKEGARASTAANDRRIVGFQTELDRIEIDEGGKAVLESSIQDTENKLHSLKDEYKAKAWDKQVEEVDQKLRSLDDQKEKLDSELVQATRHAGDSARLDFLRKEVKDRDHSLQTMVSAHGSKITEAVGNGWQPSTLESDFQACLERSSQHLTEAERQRDGTTREFDQLSFRHESCKSDLKSKRSELATKEKKLREFLGSDFDLSEYPAELEKTAAARDEQMKYTESVQHVLGFWEKALQTAEDEKCCRVCYRKYDLNRDAKGYQSLLGIIRNEITKAQNGADPKLLQDAENDLADMKSYEAAYDTWARLKNKELPPLVAEEYKIKSRHDSLVRQTEEEDQKVRQRLDAKRDIESLSKTVQNIVKYSNEMTNITRQTEELSEKQKHAGLSRGLEAIQEDLKKVNDESRTTKVSLTKTVGERDGARGIINALELELRDSRSRLSTAIYQLKEKTSLEKQVDELKAQNAEYREVLKSTDNEIRSLSLIHI